MKKMLYVLLTVLLMTIVSFIVHLVFAAEPTSTSCVAAGFLWDSLCVLPAWSLYSVPLSGVVAGCILGQTWWRIVYVEHRHWRRRF
ncbi:MAG TPA: hypothetical protein PKV72_05435 [Candidatus Peribacteria bacterium]|nr:hypothetical protein [Candidatus Peribacteria bacterium]